MSENDFELKLTHIEEQAAALHERATGYQDQEMAKLFVETEWSQQELAEKLAKRWSKEVSREWVRDHLKYGRFLTFFGRGTAKDEFKLPANLTITAFIRFYDATEASGDFRGHKAQSEAAVADEQRRFGEVIEQLRDMDQPKVAEMASTKGRRAVKDAIISLVEGNTSGWLTAMEIAERIQEDIGDPREPEVIAKKSVIPCLQGSMTRSSADSPYRVERSRNSDGDSLFRVVKIKGKLPTRKQIEEWVPKLLPMLDNIIRECQKERVAISLTSLAANAVAIKRVLEGFVGDVSTEQEDRCKV